VLGQVAFADGHRSCILIINQGVWYVNTHHERDMYTVKVQLEFSAAHTIRGYDGRCSRPHGHNWKVIVTASTSTLDQLGMSIDFYALQDATQQIIDRFDHRDMNEIPPFDSLNPTSENIAKHFYDELTKKLKDPVRVGSVTIHETDAYSATYAPA